MAVANDDDSDPNVGSLVRSSRPCLRRNLRPRLYVASDPVFAATFDLQFSPTLCSHIFRRLSSSRSVLTMPVHRLLLLLGRREAVTSGAVGCRSE